MKHAASRAPLPRRDLLRSGSALSSVGILVLTLPSPAAAASVETSGTSGSLQSFTIDDTVATAAGADLTLLVRLFDTSGGPFTGTVDVTSSVRLDDGAGDGAGSPADGASINGVTGSSAVVASTDGSAEFSFVFPAAATYLIRITTQPTAATLADGALIAHVHSG
jgi:hypothetical protein